MPHKRFLNDSSGSAIQWFAYAAAGLTVLSMVGAQSLSRMADAGKLPMVALRSPIEVTGRVRGDDVDLLPTGVVAVKPPAALKH